MIDLRYLASCPGCGGTICSQRLAQGILCRRCQPDGGDPCQVESRYQKICDLNRREAAFEELFQRLVGAPLRELQRTWSKRALLGISYALLAPTGLGKSTFGLVLATFLRPKKSYLLFPTRLLARQAAQRLRSWGCDPLLYESNASRKQKILLKERIEAGDFSILITTTNFLYRNYHLIPPVFQLIFVDDVDSIIKRARSIDKLLLVAGFDPTLIEKALARLEGRSEEPLQLPEHHATLIVSSATATPRSKRVQLFRELLGFEVGRPSLAVRNVEDLYEPATQPLERAITLAKRLGPGGLLFLSPHRGKEALEEVVKALGEAGIRAQSYEELDIEGFRRGEVEVAVGFASARNPLARGIDAPETIRYALFLGVPRMLLRLDRDDHRSLFTFLKAIWPALPPQERQWAQEAMDYLQPLRFIPLERLAPQVLQRLDKIKAQVATLLTPELVASIQKDPFLPLQIDEGEIYVVVADAVGYIQASGRTSRLWAGGLSKGLAYLLVDDEKAFANLRRRLSWFGSIDFKAADQVDLDRILAEIDADREKMRTAQTQGGIEDPFKTTLVIVESPNKARTIANFYGKPLVRHHNGVRIFEILTQRGSLTIAASKGHLFDLEKEEGFHGVIKEEDHFVELFEPIDQERLEILETLRLLGVEVGEIFIATDPDREGEKIGYDLGLNLTPFNPHIRRAAFHEVTPRAFEQALQEPQGLDENLVRAQLLRRVADRWIGFEISRYLQRRFHNPHLSAGRVQTAVLEWIVLREEEARQIVWIVEAQVAGESIPFQFDQREEAAAFFEKLQRVEVQFHQDFVKERTYTPFTTDRMLAQGSKELKRPPHEIMELAQQLFEAGVITYHRTDSIRVSPAGIALAREYISQRFGPEYFQPRSFETSQGAHEAIRPTRPMEPVELEEFAMLHHLPFTRDHFKLYHLIFATFIASQMRPAKIRTVHATIQAQGREVELELPLAILQHGNDLILPPPLSKLTPGSYPVQEKRLLKRPKIPRYTYASLIERMRLRGIGRPSTYAVTIEKLLERRYIYERGGSLGASRLGIAVYQEIRAHPKMYRFVNEHYTRELEERMDRIAAGEGSLEEELERLYREITKELTHGNS
ncbi:MAG: reverse gyrase [Nitratiruptor sp.]|nr:reverse gyrase [Nitratiruptor sp.]NPA83659.1 reverse gyrase [Campylobacterota bacterium]